LTDGDEEQERDPALALHLVDGAGVRWWGGHVGEDDLAETTELCVGELVRRRGHEKVRKCGVSDKGREIEWDGTGNKQGE
jgi:predicted DNA-binding protein with PD1-like motif